MSAMLIACKYEEIWPPEVNDLIAISDNAYSGEHILVMEKAILSQLGWYLTVPIPYVFLVRYTKASIPSDDEPTILQSWPLRLFMLLGAPLTRPQTLSFSRLV
ncbi:putative cyclin [Helianthus annuus]|nr:putative cyclin [Helianthus annuus]